MPRHVQATEENELTIKQEAFITALLSLPTIVAAAKAAKVSEKTGRRWLKEPHILAAYQEAKDTIFNESLSELRSGVATAISTLKRNMTSDDAQPSTQVAAAKYWLDTAISLHKTEALERRLAELEQLIKLQPGSR